MFRGYRRSRHLPRFLNAEQDPGEFSFGLTLGQGVVGATDVGARRAELLIPQDGGTARHLMDSS
jgi:hypothetical protein